MIPFTNAEQLTWQRTAVAILVEMLGEAQHADLPALSWTISNSGCDLIGNAYMYPTTDRRPALQAWARHLGIELEEHPRPERMTRIVGQGRHKHSRGAGANVVLAAEVDDDEDQDQEQDRQLAEPRSRAEVAAEARTQASRNPE